MRKERAMFLRYGIVCGILGLVVIGALLVWRGDRSWKQEGTEPQPRPILEDKAQVNEDVTYNTRRAVTGMGAETESKVWLQIGTDALYIKSLSLFPDQETGLYLSLDKKELCCFDISTGGMLWNMEGQLLFAVSLQDSSSVLAAPYQGNHILRVEMATGTIEETIGLPEGHHVLDLSGNNALLRTKEELLAMYNLSDKKMDLLDLGLGSRFVQGNKLIYSVEGGPGSYRLVIADHDGRILKEIEGVRQPVKSICSSPSGKFLAYASGATIYIGEDGQYDEYTLTIVDLQGDSLYSVESSEKIRALSFMTDNEVVFAEGTRVMLLESGAKEFETLRSIYTVPQNKPSNDTESNYITALWIGRLKERDIGASADTLGEIQLWTW